MARDKRINLVIVTNEPFPIGMAATNRILSYSKGIVELGHSVTVFCLRPPNIEGEKVFNSEIQGEIEGVEFLQVSGSITWPRNKLKKISLEVRSYIISFKKLISLKKIENNSIILLYSPELLHIIIFYIISRFLKLKYFRESTEFPNILSKKSIFRKLYSWLYINSVFKLFDGMVVITKSLLNYYKTKVSKSARLLHLPMIVDINRFKSLDKSGSNNNYLAYVGDMGLKKDGVDILVNSFALIAQKYSDLNLYLIGEASFKSELNNLKNLVQKYSLEKRVIFTGRVSRDQIPGYLINAKLLCLARPSSRQAEYGFPTKLGEYLITGNPVVITRVGEIPNYLVDNESAFICEPDDYIAYANKLDYALSNPHLAEKIGRKGKEVAEKKFNYLQQAKSFIDFLNN